MNTAMNSDRDEAERERDRHAGEHHDQRDAAEQEAEREDAHRTSLAARSARPEMADRLQQELQDEQRHAGRHQAVGNRERRRERRRRRHPVDPGLVEQRPRLPREERAERERHHVDGDDADAVDARGQDARDRLDADVPALRLHPGAREEHGADDAEHGDLVLPVGRGLEQVAREHAVGEHERRDEQRDHADDRYGAIDAVERDLEEPEAPVVEVELALGRAGRSAPVVKRGPRACGRARRRARRPSASPCSRGRSDGPALTAASRPARAASRSSRSCRRSPSTPAARAPAIS